MERKHLQLRTKQKFMANNGFKPSYAMSSKGMMEDCALGCRMKGNVHIISHIKTIKQLWQVVYDMVYGQTLPDLDGIRTDNALLPKR